MFQENLEYSKGRWGAVIFFFSNLEEKTWGFFPGKSQANSPKSGQVVKEWLCLSKQRLSHFSGSHELRWKCSKGSCVRNILEIRAI